MTQPVPELRVVADSKLAEHRVSSSEMARGRFLQVMRDTVTLPDGTQAEREYIMHPGAAMVIALTDDNQVVLERQFRYPIGKIMIEFPAGKLDAGEDPLVCAQRELREETGYIASQWARAGVTHNAIAYSTEVIHIFFAKDLKQGERNLDAGEFLEVFTATPQALLDWVRQGLVTDAKTQVGSLWLQNWLSGQWSLDWQTNARPAAR